MSATVHLQEVGLQISPLQVETGDFSSGCPLPRLSVSGPPQARALEGIVLENDWIRAVFLPELGGRLHSFVDKSSGRELLGTNVPWEALPGGPRGVVLPFGWEWTVADRDGLGSLVEVAAQISEGGEDGAARLVLFGMTPGCPISWHLWAEAPEDEPALSLTLRAFNRTLQPQPCELGFRVWGRDTRALRQGGLHVIARQDGGVLIEHEGCALDRLERFDDRVELRRGVPRGVLAPRQSDVAHYLLRPLDDIGTPIALADGVVAGLDGNVLRLQSWKPSGSLRVFVQLETGETLEATTESGPDEVACLELPAGSVLQAGAVFDLESRELLRWPADSTEPFELESVLPGFEEVGSGSIEVRRRAPEFRAGAWLETAHAMVREERWHEASAAVQQSLLFNGDDPLGWWLSAAIERQSGEEESRAHALSNAHFLAPLEPLLRAEAFLGTPEDPYARLSPLVAPLTADSDALVEVSVRLLEAGFRSDAARWIEECLRHREAAMLRVLLAAILLESGIPAEAGIQIAQLEGTALSPPYPWREWERDALQRLADQFPASEALPKLLQAMGRSK